MHNLRASHIKCNKVFPSPVAKACNHVWSYLVKRPQDLLSGVRLKVAIDQMRYHEARSARFIGHRWGRGWRDATENLLQTSIIEHLRGRFPLRRICGTRTQREKHNLFFFLFFFFNPSSLVRVFSGWGQCCVGEGWKSSRERGREGEERRRRRGTQTNKQTN